MAPGMRPSRQGRQRLRSPISTTTDIAQAGADMGMNAYTMAWELGIRVTTMKSYMDGSQVAPRSVLLALEWVRAGYLARRACIDAGQQPMPELETVT